jgi:hypothetical protein
MEHTISSFVEIVSGPVYCEGRTEVEETVKNPGSSPIDDIKNKESVEESICGVAREWLIIFDYCQ